MRLEYSMQISPFPIPLSIGTLKKPKLREIFDTSLNMSFEKFERYEFFLKMTPKYFYTKIKKDEGGIKLWDSLTDKEQKELTMYDVLTNDEQLKNIYIEIFNYFFIEKVVFEENCFILLKNELEGLSSENIRGIIHPKIFNEVLDIICQICCINNEDNSSKNLVFKNKLAKKLYDKMHKTQNSEKNKNNGDIDLTIPNIISSISAQHPSLNYSNIWDLTIFQLLDNFNRLRMNSIYKINSVRVSVWGDEKKTFDTTIWYKNHYDSKS